MLNFGCRQCGTACSRFFRRAEGAALKCKCGADMDRTLSAPTASSRLTVDNGSQARAVEIVPEILKLNEERALRGQNRGD
jgi:hypothetical protein